jgi:hypothetical protein
MVAWEGELDVLGGTIPALIQTEPAAADWTLLLEYEIPRRQRRIDAVLLAGTVVLVLEFKVGAERFERAAIWQAEDYALDLRDFHAASRGKMVLPFLVATRAKTPPREETQATDVCLVGTTGLAECLLAAVRSSTKHDAETIDAYAWDASAYSPTPGIVEATQRLFAGHNVRELSHTYADNLTGTVDAIARAIEVASKEGRRTICFTTGVPGAGKTLAGLAAVHAPEAGTQPNASGAFLSGNGPLVRILREAIVRDAASRGSTRRAVRRKAEHLVQNVHVFIEEYGVRNPNQAPPEHVIVFDEAQRAWDAPKLEKRHRGLFASEPALVLDAMARPPGWCTIVALIGGGQEIHSGEAGLEEWGRALAASRDAWHAVLSPEVLHGGVSVAHHKLFEHTVPSNVTVSLSPLMHLSVSVRSPRAQYWSEWVEAVLSLDLDSAQRAVQRVNGFRLALTRDLDAARRWLRDAAHGDRRPGLLASSGCLRHRAYGLEMSTEFHRSYPIEDWFLGLAMDVRSSSMLEVAMTEFECQGLELDFVGLCWGDDLTIGPAGNWLMRTFKGTRWLELRDQIRRRYLLNKYRVLLTRARDGMIIWVPPGDPHDSTRDPSLLDQTAAYLEAAGLQRLDGCPGARQRFDGPVSRLY